MSGDTAVDPASWGIGIRRAQFVSPIVVRVYTEHGGADAHVSDALTKIILDRAFVPESEWQALVKSEPPWLDFGRMDAVLTTYLTEMFDKHPATSIEPSQFPEILDEIAQKAVASGKDCEWPYSWLCEQWKRLTGRG